MVIEAVVTGYRGSDGDGQQVIRPAFKAEHLETDEERTQGTVCDAAEQAAHADRSGKTRGNSHERTDYGPESGADKERGNDLTALEAGRDRDSGKQYFEKESGDRYGFAVQALRDDVAAGAVIELSAGEKGHGQKDNGHYDGSRDRPCRDLSRQGRNLAKSHYKENAHQGAQYCQEKGGDGHGQ